MCVCIFYIIYIIWSIPELDGVPTKLVWVDGRRSSQGRIFRRRCEAITVKSGDFRKMWPLCGLDGPYPMSFSMV